MSWSTLGETKAESSWILSRTSSMTCSIIGPVGGRTTLHLKNVTELNPRPAPATYFDILLMEQTMARHALAFRNVDKYLHGIEAVHTASWFPSILQPLAFSRLPVPSDETHRSLPQTQDTPAQVLAHQWSPRCVEVRERPTVHPPIVCCKDKPRRRWDPADQTVQALSHRGV